MLHILETSPTRSQNISHELVCLKKKYKKRVAPRPVDASRRTSLFSKPATCKRCSRCWVKPGVITDTLGQGLGWEKELEVAPPGFIQTVKISWWTGDEVQAELLTVIKALLPVFHTPPLGPLLAIAHVFAFIMDSDHEFACDGPCLPGFWPPLWIYEAAYVKAAFPFYYAETFFSNLLPSLAISPSIEGKCYDPRCITTPS